MLHVFSCYAPTYVASREKKVSFFSTLQEDISSLSHRDYFMMLGDYTIQVGSRQNDDQWQNERGPFGYGVLNDAGRKLLAFVGVNEATACNTWFTK